MNSNLHFTPSAIEPCVKDADSMSSSCQDAGVENHHKTFLSNNVITTNSEEIAPEDLLQNIKYESDPYDIDKLIKDIQEEDVISTGSPISGNNDLDFIASINVPSTDAMIGATSRSLSEPTASVSCINKTQMVDSSHKSDLNYALDWDA